MKFKIAICDDEKIISEEIKARLLALHSDYLVDIFHSGEQLLESDKIFDYIFLDIEMPGIGGMATAQMLREKDRNDYIIFLTSHTEFMSEAFKVKAFRFLNKPIQEEIFSETVEEIEKEILNNEKILLDISNETKLFNLKDLLCFEAFGDGTYIHTKSGVVETKQPLKYWVQRMENEHFFQIHKSYFVALRYVRTIGKNVVTMHYMKEHVPVSRRRMKEFKEAFLQYVNKYGRLM